MGLEVHVTTESEALRDPPWESGGLVYPDRRLLVAGRRPAAQKKAFALISGDSIRITYFPEPGDLSTKILFIQVMRELSEGVAVFPSTLDPDFAYQDKDTTITGFMHVDYINGEKDPYYTGEDAADKSAAVEARQGNALTKPPRTAHMRDAPGYDDANLPAGTTKMKYEFRTAAFSAEGKDAGSYYRFVDWTFEKEKGKPSRLRVIRHGSDPGQAFIDAVSLWCGNNGFTLPTPPDPGDEPDETTYVVQRGDYLSKLAQRFYGNAGLWHKIYDANRAVIGPNPNLIYPGQELVIP